MHNNIIFTTHKSKNIAHFIIDGTTRVNMDFLAHNDLGAKNRARPKRDGNSQCGKEFYPKIIAIWPPLYYYYYHKKNNKNKNC